MTVDRNREVARDVLTTLGYCVEEIPETQGQKRADFIARVGEEVHVVEAKSRTISEQYGAQLKAKTVAARTEQLGRVNAVARRMKDARQQLNATPAPAGAFRIVAFVAVGLEPGVRVRQVEYSLYGIKDVLPDIRTAALMPCYYGTYSEFYKYPEIDAVLVVGPQGSKVCPNYFGGRLNQFRATTMYTVHAACCAIRDPEAEEASGSAYMADESFADDRLLELHLQQKYGLVKPIVVNLKSDSVAMFSPDDKDQNAP